ncbi:hypothetical protein PAEPH01_2414 [Pancytospora epiphaga]|nr:hypothetical protein PAEPH01_2414 [Pancytospora epiphaga]
MLSLAHAIYFILGVFPEKAFHENLGICLDEINKRLSGFEENISLVAFVLSNLVELRVILTNSNDTQAYSQVDPVVTTLFNHLCSMQTASLDDLLPAAILDYQHLKEFRVRESIYKKIFAGPSITKLIDHLSYFYSLDAYFYLPDVIVINNLSYLLSYMDYVCFNSLLTKRKFLNTNRCIQIKYNLSEIEKFCFNMSFHHGFYNMAYMREAARLAMALSSGSIGNLPVNENTMKSRNISENTFTTFDNFGNACSFSVTRSENIGDLIENSLLNLLQINTIVELFENSPLKVTGDSKNIKKYIDEPRPVVPSLSELTTRSKFIKPKYLPDKSLKSIFKVLKQKQV